MSGCSMTPSPPSPMADADWREGFLFSRDGELKVSVVQEGLTRVIKPKGA